MGNTHSDVARRWVHNCLTRGTDRTLRAIRNHNIFPEGDQIFSYGHHFELARALRDRKGGLQAFLVNGDTFSNTTSRHQSELRSALIGHGDNVIVPYSVLNAAGIDLDTVRIVSTESSREIVTTRTYYEEQPRWSWADVPEYKYRQPTDEELAERLAGYNAEQHKKWLDHVGMAWREMDKGDLFGFWITHDYHIGEAFPPKPLTIEAARAKNEGSTWTWGLGRVFEEVQYVTEVNRRLFTNHHHNPWSEVEVEYVGDLPMSYTVTSRRHVLGEAVIEGTTSWSRRRRCQECGTTGTRPRVGHDWEFQCPRCRGAGFWWQRMTRVARYLSGFDHNEPTLSYFFCELPTRTATTVDEAYAELKPDTVKVAEQMEREVFRQGDIFAIEMPLLTKRDLTAMGARHERMGDLLNTNHAASEVAYLPDGRTLARGILRHRPDGRRPDHVMCRLSKGTWHLIVKNTVPVNA